MARFLQFPPDASLGNIPEELIERLGSGQPLIARDAALRTKHVVRLERELRVRASRLDSAAQDLRALVTSHRPTELIPAIAVPASMGTWRSDGSVDDASETFSWDAKIEYLAGLALTASPGTSPVDNAVREQAIQLVAAVFDACHADIFLRSVERDHAEDRLALDEASYLMQVEHLTDRMGGYAVHLEEIADAVFERHRAVYVEALGFCPSDAVHLIRRHSAWINDQFEQARARHLAGGDGGDRRAEAMPELSALLDAAVMWTARGLAGTTGIAVAEVDALLEHLSCEFGCQPEMRLPSDDNALRVRPLIKVGKGMFLAPTPWSVAHAIHVWLLDHLRRSPDPKLQTAYHRHRSSAAEGLVQAALSAVFGPNRVHTNQHYDGSEGHGEVDCLVGGGTPMIVEVKSQSVTERGRRGNRDRLERVADDILERAFDQCRRAADYINNGGREFAGRQSGLSERRLDSDVADPLEVVVSFERIDPLGLTASGITGSRRPVWVTNLADLLMVRDVLWDGASFLDYARIRAELSQSGAQIYVESDALGGYLEDRLSLVRDKVGDGTVILGYSSGALNDYFTRAELGIESTLPGSSLPTVIRRGLLVTGIEQNSVRWWNLAINLVQQPRDTWVRWKRFVRRHGPGRVFLLPDGRAGLLVLDGAEQAKIRHVVPPVLVLPARALDATS